MSAAPTSPVVLCGVDGAGLCPAWSRWEGEKELLAALEELFKRCSPCAEAVKASPARVFSSHPRGRAASLVSPAPSPPTLPSLCP